MEKINLQKQIDYVSREIVYNSFEIIGIKKFIATYHKLHLKESKRLPAKDQKSYMREIKHHIKCRKKEIQAHQKEINLLQSILNSLKQLEGILKTNEKLFLKRKKSTHNK